MTQNKVNFTERHLHGGWAKYLPAISGFYTTHLGKDLSDEKFIPKERVPEQFELGIQGLDFLKSPDDAYFSYKFGLYSAGHAERKLDKCDDREPMIHKRDRENTIIIGDSGGFQIATGVIKMDWTKVMTPDGDKLREEILRYLEHTSDWSMTLDVPAFAALPPLSAKTGLTKFQDCLDVTLYNLDYFIKNRVVGATKFLNVLSGSSPETSKQWYDAVIPYSIPECVEGMGLTPDRAFEGWAFAGVNMRDMKSVLERLIDLREDGLLETKDWIHFLGIGRLDWACYLTSIERQLKKYNPNINISFDAASPFVAAGGYALSYNYNHFETDQLTYAMGRCLDDKSLKGSKLGMTFQGPIMERCTVGDICVMGPGDLNKHGKEGKTSWDTTTYAIVMAHNVYNHIQAIQEINRHADIVYAIKKVDYRDWAKKKTKTPICDFLPNNIFFFNSFVEELFSRDAAGARQLIKDYSGHLDNISFKENKIVDSVHSIFDWDAVDAEPVIKGEDIASLDKEDLIQIDE
jgi:hypothetical protein